MFLSNTSKEDHRRVQEMARSETGPLLNKTNICRFSSARLKLMTSCECTDRENGIGLCTRGPLRPDICFGECCGWSVWVYIVCAHMCVEMAGEGEADRRPQISLSFFFFFWQCVYPPMFIQVDEEECVSTGKTTTVFLSLQSLLLRTDNGITHQRSFCLYPILL